MKLNKIMIRNSSLVWIVMYEFTEAGSSFLLIQLDYDSAISIADSNLPEDPELNLETEIETSRINEARSYVNELFELHKAQFKKLVRISPGDIKAIITTNDIE